MRFLLAMLVCAVALVPTRGRAETITVSAAVSLKEALTDVAAGYEAETGERVRLNFGGSGQLVAQVKEGAPVDLFVSAADRELDELARLNLVDPDTRRVIATNALVLIVPAGAAAAAAADAPGGFASLSGPRFGKVAIGQPKTVPAGAYAVQVLDALKIADALADRLVYGTNVRQVLDYVERGEVDAGIVYRTDALAAGEKVTVVATADPSHHRPIRYPAAVVAASPKAAAARRFLAYLATDEAQAVLAARGFARPMTTTAPAR